MFYSNMGKYERSKASVIRQTSPCYESLYDLNNVYNEFNRVRKASHYKPQVQSFYWNQLRYSYLISEDLKNNTYQPDGVTSFKINERGKVRSIKANTVKDRVVNSLLETYILKPLTEPKLIYDNGASRIGMGVSHTRKRVEKHLHDAMLNYGEDAVILLFDLSNYFGNMSISKLLEMYEEIVEDKRCMELLKQQLYAHNEGDIGVGIGSILSQNAGIYYLHSFDNYIKIVLGRKYYARYMDDFYIICKNHREARELRPKVESYLETNLAAIVNKKKTQQCKLTQGFKFLKFFYKVDKFGKIYKRQDNDTFIRERRKLSKFKNTKMSKEDIINAYKSWRGSVSKEKHNMPRIRRVDKIFEKLYK